MAAGRGVGALPGALESVAGFVASEAEDAGHRSAAGNRLKM
jgi:hypothetical protein